MAHFVFRAKSSGAFRNQLLVSQAISLPTMPLVDSDKWKAAFVSLNALRFHPHNPRLASLSSKASEREIIEELCERSKVEVIARSIVDKGYLRNERLIVYRDGAKNIVYEGNRRLCALKVLANPELAPKSKQKTFKRLSEKAKLPAKVAVDVVPSVFDAEVVMFVKHAGSAYMEGWKPVQQATFIAARLEAGETVDELATNYGLSRAEITRARALIDLYRMCRLAPLSEAAQELVANPEAFPTSIIFERLIEPKKIGSLLGFEITDKGLFAPSGADTLALLARILEDIASDDDGKRLDTRSLNTEEDQLAYVAKLRFKPAEAAKVDANAMEEAARPKAKEGSATSTNSTQPQGGAQTSKSKSSGRTATVSGRLFPRSLVCEIKNKKLLALIDEGKQLEVSSAPNTCSLLMRCVLDISLQLAMDQRGVVAAIVAKYKKKNRDRLSTVELLEETKSGGLLDIGLDGMELRTIDPLKATGPISYDSLHLVIHNVNWRATADNVLQLRDIVVPIIQKAVRKP